MPRVTYLKPQDTFSGGKIGIEGNTIWLLPERLKTNFRQGLVEVDYVGTDAAEKPLAFYANRNITGTISVSGKYAAADSHERRCLEQMCKIDPVTDVVITLDTGITLTGNLLVMSDQNEWGNGSNGAFLNFNTTFQFTGSVVGDGMTDSAFDGDSGSGTKYTNLKQVTGAERMTYTRSYYDSAEDRWVEPFIVVGITEGSGVPLSVAEAGVVTAMGGGTHTCRADSTIPFSRINSRWAGLNLIVGELIYDHNALDCSSMKIEYDIGFVVKGKEGEVIAADSGSDIDNVCVDLASGPFGIRFTHWRDSARPYTIILLPCVWTTNPRLDTSVVAMIGNINNATVTIDGVNYSATELRFDGFKNVRKFTNPQGTKYVGMIKFSHLAGGWYDGFMVCTRMVPLPLEGNQTLPSYTIEASVVRLYDYDRVAFDTIAQICPVCFG